jgi:hypothetical protein
MRRNRITLGALALLALLVIPVPAALAGGPLLSGYGGPGAGAQSIIGGTLLNGPKGGSGGGSSGSGSGGSSSSSSSFSSSSSSSSSSATNASHVATGRGPAASGSARGRGASPAPRRGGGEVSTGRGASAGSAGAYGSRSHTEHTEASMAASVSSAGSSWFTGGDLLALVLVAGVLALVAVATMRLSGMGAHHE